jgi:hypothetical protein
MPTGLRPVAPILWGEPSFAAVIQSISRSTTSCSKNSIASVFSRPHARTWRTTVRPGLLPYNHFNDRLAAILQHEAVRLGFIPSRGQSQFFLDTLYDLDRFRERCLADPGLNPAEKARLGDDESLLLFAMDLVEEKLSAGLPKVLSLKESRRC